MAGERFYNTGKPCSKGHMAPRYVCCAACSICHEANRQRWKAGNPEKIRKSEYKYRRSHLAGIAAKSRRWMLSNPKNRMLISARFRASKSGLEFSITVDDFSIPERCPVFGMVLNYGVGRQAPNSPSLDRVDSKLGYVPGNVRVISHRANTLKGDATAGELEALASYVKSHIRHRAVSSAVEHSPHTEFLIGER